MIAPNQHEGPRGTVASMSALDGRAKALKVLTRRRVSEWDLFWVSLFSALFGALLGWLIFPEHFAVGGMAAIGWTLATVSVQQCVQLRREMNALITLVTHAGPNGG